MYTLRSRIRSNIKFDGTYSDSCPPSPDADAASTACACDGWLGTAKDADPRDDDRGRGDTAVCAPCRHIQQCQDQDREHRRPTDNTANTALLQLHLEGRADHPRPQLT